MDSLKTLFDKKQYKLIVSLTENSNDETGLFYRLSSLTSLGEYSSALTLIEQHRKIFEKNMIALLKIHFEILFQLNEFDKAYKEIEYYQSCPYVSQEVEEYLTLLPKIVRSAEKGVAFQKDVSNEELITIFLTNTDDYEVLLAMEKIKSADKTPFISSLVKVCLSENRLHPYVRTYALLILVDAKYNKELSFPKNGKTYHIVPCNLFTPYTGIEYNNFIKKMTNLCRNPSLTNVAINMLNEYVMNCYPDNIFGKNDDLLLASLIALADSYFSTNEDINFIAKELNLNIEEVKNEKKIMEQRLLSIAPLKI